MATDPDDTPPAGSGGTRPEDMRRYRHTWRLRFEFDGRELHLRSRTKVAMIAPPSMSRRPEVGTDIGVWVELVDDDGRPVFHRVVPGALSTRVEHHTPGRTPEVYVSDPQPGVFEVLVPDVPEGHQIVVNGPSLDRERASELDGRSEELARFALRDDTTDGDTDDDGRKGDD